MTGLNISWHGVGGEIKIPGLGAVLATFDGWTLKSRGENRRERPMWNLHGSLSYINETLYRELVANGYPMRITLTTQGKAYSVELGDVPAEITGNRIVIKEITLDER